MLISVKNSLMLLRLKVTRPHRHSLDPKEECLIAVRGLFGLIEFSDHGGIESITLFGSEKYSQKFSIASGVSLPAGVWHTVV